MVATVDVDIAVLDVSTFITKGTNKAICFMADPELKQRSWVGG